jgi:hypothetical protein
MTKTDMEELYKVACQGKGYKGSDGQFKVWVLTLGHLEKADLAAAMVEYFTNNTGFPMPAELKPLAEAAKRKRTEVHHERRRVTFVCPVCSVRVSAFLAPGESTMIACRSIYTPWKIGQKEPQRFLPRDPATNDYQVCGAILDVEMDERAA